MKEGRKERVRSGMIVIECTQKLGAKEADKCLLNR